MRCKWLSHTVCAAMVAVVVLAVLGSVVEGAEVVQKGESAPQGRAAPAEGTETPSSGGSSGWQAAATAT